MDVDLPLIVTYIGSNLISNPNYGLWVVVLRSVWLRSPNYSCGKYKIIYDYGSFLPIAPVHEVAGSMFHPLFARERPDLVYLVDLIYGIYWDEAPALQDFRALRRNKFLLATWLTPATTYDMIHYFDI